tara:strand:+ start:487 stop:1245 length:759 start_codon:yes stop_codon:yes gene_type:complete
MLLSLRILKTLEADVQEKINISIIIPVYNEVRNIPILLNEINIVIRTIGCLTDYEIILIDDYSSDGSRLLIKEIDDIKVSKLFNSSNKGQSYCFHKGIKSSKFDIIITLDSDLQNNPNDIPRMLRLYISDTNIKLLGGLRTKRKDSLIKIVSSRLANKIRSFLLDDDCLDTGCSLKVFDKFVFLQFPFFNGMHRFLPALFKGYGSKTVFLSVDHRYRRFGNSKYGTILRLLSGVRDIIKVALIIKKLKRNRA